MHTYTHIYIYIHTNYTYYVHVQTCYIHTRRCTVERPPAPSSTPQSESKTELFASAHSKARLARALSAKTAPFLRLLLSPILPQDSYVTLHCAVKPFMSVFPGYVAEQLSSAIFCGVDCHSKPRLLHSCSGISRSRLFSSDNVQGRDAV